MRLQTGYALATAAVGFVLLATGAGAAQPRVALGLVARGLDEPLYVTAAPSERGRLFVVEKKGVVRVLDGRTLLPKAFLDLHARVDDVGEQGLLSIAFDPRYAKNHYVYAAYSDLRGYLNLSRFTVRGDAVDPSTEQRLARIAHTDSPYHNGGLLLFGPDGYLYAGVGDGGYLNGVATGPNSIDPHGNAQNLHVLLGKLLRFDVRAAQPKPEIVAYGLRNPWRFAFAPNGDLVIGDVGWNNYEEVDVLAAHAKRPVNFGWSDYEGSHEQYSPGTALNRTGKLVFPVYQYATRIQDNCSITGGFVYRGHEIPSLRGKYVFGDYCSGRIWATTLHGAGKASKPQLPTRTREGLDSFGQGADGSLYVVFLGGAVYRLAAR